jgi:hypothetical protein
MYFGVDSRLVCIASFALMFIGSVYFVIVKEWRNPRQWQRQAIVCGGFILVPFVLSSNIAFPV